MSKSPESEIIRIAAEMLTNQINYLERPTKRDILNHRRKQWTWAMDLKAIVDKMQQPIAHADVQSESKE